MGLFRKKKPAPQPAPQYRDPLVYAEPWNIPQPTKQIYYHGPWERNLHVYNFEPLSNVRPNEIVYLDAYRGDAALLNEFGDIWDNRESGSTLVLYNGEIVGFANFKKEFVRRAAAAGFAMKIAAAYQHTTTYNGRLIPDYKTLEPEERFDDVLENVIFSSHGVPRDAATFTFYEEELAKRPELQGLEFIMDENPLLSFAPVQEGSKAKPAIKLTANNGFPITEARPRQQIYNALCAAMSEQTNRFVLLVRKPKQSDDGAAGYHIVLKCWQR